MFSSLKQTREIITNFFFQLRLRLAQTCLSHIISPFLSKDWLQNWTQVHGQDVATTHAVSSVYASILY